MQTGPSGRQLQIVENIINKTVKPMHANPHNVVGQTSSQCSDFVAQSQAYIREEFKVADDKEILFVGRGCTGAILMFIEIMKRSNWLRTKRNGQYITLKDGMQTNGVDGFTASDLNEMNKHCQTDHYKEVKNKQESTIGVGKPLVLITKNEHHSNIITWRDEDIDLEEVEVDRNRMIDLTYLGDLLEQKKKDHQPLICSFALASNLTGHVQNQRKVSELVRSKGAYMLWDAAQAAAQVEVDSNLSDGLFLSPHKFVGGPGSSGVLVLSKELMCNEKPTAGGGGTVFFVDKKSHQYVESGSREQGGSPNVEAQVRAGLAIRLKSLVGVDIIQKREHHIKKICQDNFKDIKELHFIQGLDSQVSDEVERLPVQSFMVKCKNRQLHPGLVSRLLSDLFGIDTRSGGVCALPYLQESLGLEKEDITAIWALLRTQDIYRTSISRVSLHWTMEDDEVNFICDAMKWVAENGFHFLKVYDKNNVQGNYTHKTFKRQAKKFDEIDIEQQEIGTNEEKDYGRTMTEADELLEQLKEKNWEIRDSEIISENAALAKKQRWFCSFEDQFLDEHELFQLKSDQKEGNKVNWFKQSIPSLPAQLSLD